jgi:protein TonB
VNLRSFSTLQLALGASIAVHAVLLTVRFVDPDSFNRVFKDTPLEVVLVNAKTNEKSDKAKVIAQHSMAGGGDAEKGRATSPLPPSALTDTGDALEQELARKLQTLQEQQTLLLAQVKNQLATMAPTDPRQTATKTEQAEREEKRGTENFPQSGGKKLYGELTMIVTVNHDGRVLKTEVVEGSGNRALDRHAAAIARTAGPFGPFSAAMRRQADQILVVSRFKFTRDETLEANVSSRP